MSNRSMLELNHDEMPTVSGEVLVAWAEMMAAYFRSGDPKHLPRGATFFNMRHHSEECPLGDPPRGWNNHSVKPTDQP